MYVLSIERIWEENDFFQIEVFAQSEFISAKVKSYTTEESINDRKRT